MNDKLDELHYIYKMIGNYGFCTVQSLLDKYIELNQENQELKERNECLLNQKKDFEYIQAKVFDDIVKKNKQLKQRDEVIDETIGMLDKLDTDIMQNTIIGFQQFLPRFYEIKEILQRYIGDNK